MLITDCYENLKSASQPLSYTIIKVADDTTVVGLITDNDETAYREEVCQCELSVWCRTNNLSLNVKKTQEMIVDYRKRTGLKWRAEVEGVESFMFLVVHITIKL